MANYELTKDAERDLQQNAKPIIIGIIHEERDVVNQLTVRLS